MDIKHLKTYIETSGLGGTPPEDTVNYNVLGGHRVYNIKNPTINTQWH